MDEHERAADALLREMDPGMQIVGEPRPRRRLPPPDSRGYIQRGEHLRQIHPSPPPPRPWGRRWLDWSGIAVVVLLMLAWTGIALLLALLLRS